MNRKTWLSLSLICCLALLTVACSLVRSGKANKEPGPAAAAPKAVETASPGATAEAGKEGQERKWESYASDRNGVDYYYEKATVTFPSKTLVHTWRRRTFPINSPQKEIISFDEIDCDDARYRSLEVEGVYWDGKTKVFKVVSPWTRIYTDSPDEVLYLDICKMARDSK